MYAFLLVLVPLATVAAWALVQDRKRRHAHGADMQSRIRAARESAKERAARWMLRVSLTMAGRAHRCPCGCLAERGLPRTAEGTGFAAVSGCAGSGEVRCEQPDLGSRAGGSGAGRVVHLRLRQRARPASTRAHRQARHHPAAHLHHTAETMSGSSRPANKGAAGYPATNSAETMAIMRGQYRTVLNPRL